jgi:choice-of-anchor B domain-containing protein
LRSSLVVLALLLIAAPAAAIPTRNIQVLSHVDEYHNPVGVIPYAYSACWGYAHPDGREYAVIGTSGGTAIYNITNPRVPYRVAFIAGPNSVWREMKQYRTWIYLVTEGTWGSLRGMQVIRMTDPDHPVLAKTYTAPNYVAAHTVSVDTTRALLYLNGTRSDAGNDVYPWQGMQIFSLAQPESPVFLSAWPNSGPYYSYEYVHDSVPVGNRVYASSIFTGTQRVIDATDPTHPVQTTSWTYPGAYYTHNAWPDSSGHTLYVTDEQNGQTLRVFDISNLSQPNLVTGWSANPKAIVHNAVVQGSELFLANYTEGLRVLDLADPLHPAEFAWADTYAGPSGGFSGIWGVCPTLPSGTIIASDMQTGLWLFRVQRGNHGRVRVQVVDAATQQPMAGVRVRVTPLGDSLVTGGDGIVQFAPPIGPVPQQVTADRFGWTTTYANVNVSDAATSSVTLALDLKPVTTFAGTIHDRKTGTELGDGEVILESTPLRAFSDDSGWYQFNAVPEDDYLVSVHRPGYVPESFPRHIGIAFPFEDFTLAPAKQWSPLESATGWTVGAPGDNPTEGAWVNVAPIGTGSPGELSRPDLSGLAGSVPPTTRLSPYDTGNRDATAARGVISTRPEPGRASSCGDTHRASAGGAMCSASGATVASATGDDDEPLGHCGCGASCVCGVVVNNGASQPVKPWEDRTPGSGTRCFVTGQADSHAVDPDSTDLDGRTTLTSQPLNLTFSSDPLIGYWRWFYSRSLATGQPDDFDWLAVLISNDNGVSWTTVDTLRGMHGQWQEAAIRVRDYVTPSAQVRVRFVASDGGANTTVEAAIDDLTLYDRPVTLETPGSGATTLRFAAPWPNPGSGRVRFALSVPTTRALTVEILDLRGARVRRLHDGPAAGPLELSWDGRDQHGHATAAGVYFAVARAGGEVARARLVRLP